jgi:hypothetical protein
VETKETTALGGRLVFYHPNAAGSGSAVRFEVHLAREGREGCVFMELAGQKSRVERDGGALVHAATFDWERKTIVKLGFTDLSALLLVLDGRAEAAGPGGKGLFHDTATATTVIGLKRVTGEASGFGLEVSRKQKAGDQAPDRHRLLLTEAEACGLRQVIQAILFRLCFYARTPADTGGSAEVSDGDNG